MNIRNQSIASYDCNLCALKKPSGEMRQHNKRYCGKSIICAMYARDTLESIITIDYLFTNKFEREPYKA